ncbi:hypothetical protein [Miltoncostaea marina]|uniref:hypothetical protein n=1 Tax=Miltoncostaea marina TaxID=2843215 RepID=UPI001C3D9192|nr:hypothetical protein [Miltoncostaea marina]
MDATLTVAETAALQGLLDRLDPAPTGACGVVGCLHVHAGARRVEDAPALAA